MLSISPIAEIKLDHRAYHVAAASSGHVVAISRRGAGSVLGPGNGPQVSFRPPAEADDLSVSPDGNLVSVAACGKVVLISTSSLRAVHSFGESIGSCQFSSTGELWTIVKGDGERVVLEIREPVAWRVAARAELADPFGSSFFKILPHPDGVHLAIWAAGGQDGQCLFWARRDGSAVAVDRFHGLESTTPPSFTHSGDRFLAICDGDELRQYGFPQGPLLGTMRWPLDDMDNQIDELVLCVDSCRALLPSTSDRLYVVDLNGMTITDEIGLRGHEPRGMAEIYPGLRGKSALCSDLAYLAALPPGNILSVHRQVPIRTGEDGSDSILVWRLPEAEG